MKQAFDDAGVSNSLWKAITSPGQDVTGFAIISVHQLLLSLLYLAEVWDLV
jgi:hypothetical protein